MIYKLIDALTCAFPHSIVGGRPSRLPVAPFAATNLKKCARTRPSPTRLQRTSKNVQPDTRDAARRRRRGGVGRGVRASPTRRPRVRVREKRFRAHFFSACCTFARSSGHFRGHPGSLGAFLSSGFFCHPLSDLRFSSERPRTGCLGRARPRNKPQKMCMRWPVRGQTRNKPQKMCSRTPAPPSEPACEGCGRGTGAPACGPRPASARRSKPAAARSQPHETCTNRRWSGASAACTLAACAVRSRPARAAICGGFVRRIRRWTNYKPPGRWAHLPIDP